VLAIFDNFSLLACQDVFPVFDYFKLIVHNSSRRVSCKLLPLRLAQLFFVFQQFLLNEFMQSHIGQEMLRWLIPLIKAKRTHHFLVRSHLGSQIILEAVEADRLTTAFQKHWHKQKVERLAVFVRRAHELGVDYRNIEFERLVVLRSFYFTQSGDIFLLRDRLDVVFLHFELLCLLLKHHLSAMLFERNLLRVVG
jgi:hypothetical protein